MAGFASGIAGGGGVSASASSSATSGDATGGALGLNIQGITTGYASNGPQGTAGSGAGGMPAYVYPGLLAIGALLAYRLVGR
jgi:hypothetical protein